MAYELRTCRFCQVQEDSRGMHKYGTRHYAHWACYFRAFLATPAECKSFIEGLHTHVVASLPVMIFAAHYRGTFAGPAREYRYHEAVAFVTKVWKRKQKEDARELALA